MIVCIKCDMGSEYVEDPNVNGSAHAHTHLVCFALGLEPLSDPTGEIANRRLATRPQAVCDGEHRGALELLGHHVQQLCGGGGVQVRRGLVQHQDLGAAHQRLEC